MLTTKLVSQLRLAATTSTVILMLAVCWMAMHVQKDAQ